MRPEKIRLAGGSVETDKNAVSGEVVKSIYLDEISQFKVQTAGGIFLKATIIGDIVSRSADNKVRLYISPEDVIILERGF